MVNQEQRELPDVLWKYRPWNENTRRMITDSEVYFAPLADLNDPLDCNWNEKYPRSKSELFRLVKHMCALNTPNDNYAERAARLASLMKQALQVTQVTRRGIIRSVTRMSHGVFCMTELNDDFLMWSHYAKNHTGVCIGIRPHHLTDRKILPCYYSEDAPVIDVWDYIRGDGQTIANATLWKAEHWAYEREWRTIEEAGPKSYPGCVAAVILGLRASDKTQAEVRQAVSEAGYPIEIYRAILHRTKSKLFVLSDAEIANIEAKFAVLR